jgi:CRP-like cAMP-binding protein
MTTNERAYEAGAIIFREGEPSVEVGLVLDGAVEVVKQTSGDPVVLARLGEGEHVGEMGVLEGRQRSATVRAVGPARLAFMRRDAFLERISTDRAMTLRLLTALSERLHRTDEQLVAGKGRAPGLPVLATQAGIVLRILPDSPLMERLLPAEGLRVDRFPFTIGRRPGTGEQEPPVAVDLVLDDERPYRLSRVHLSLIRLADGVAVSDPASTLGTAVNGIYLGEHFASVREPLEQGENRVVAGGVESPFAFRLVLG